jgi:hypothetical protein
MRVHLLLSALAAAMLLAGIASPMTAAPGDLSAPAVQESICPPDDPRARANVDRFMTSPTFADDRQRLEIGDRSPADVRGLADLTDAEACRALNEAITLGKRPYPRLKTYYTVGNYYLVATITVVPEDRIYLSFEPLLILDRSTLRPVVSLAM